MTYGELSRIKTNSMEVNSIIDDAVNNCRFSMTRAELRRGEMDHQIVSDYVLNVIRAAIVRYGSDIPHPDLNIAAEIIPNIPRAAPTARESSSMVAGSRCARPAKSSPSGGLRFLWNGIKDSDGRLQRCWYNCRNWIPGIDPETVGITAKDYKNFSGEIRAAFTVQNDSDLMTDYFDSDRIKVSPDHPLYADVRAAYDAQQAHRERRVQKLGL